MSDEVRVSVPRARLQAWADVLTQIGGDRRLPSSAAGQLLVTADSVALWAQQVDSKQVGKIAAGIVEATLLVVPVTRPLGAGEDDTEVWIPPKSDAVEHRPDRPCPHCGLDYHHVRTGRCAECGRRSGAAPPICTLHQVPGPDGEPVPTPEYGCKFCQRWLAAQRGAA